MINYCNRLFFENLKLTNIENVLLAAIDAASKFQFLRQLGYVSKDAENPCSRCICYIIPLPRIRQILRNYFLRHNLDISLTYPSYMLVLIIFGDVMLQFIKINRKCVVTNSHMPPMLKTRFLRHVHLSEVC